MKINIELDLKNLIDKGSNFVIRPDAEFHILKLFEAQEKINDAIDKIQKAIKEDLLKLSSEATQIQGDNIRAKLNGAKYELVGDADKKFIKITKIDSERTTLITAVMEKYMRENRK